MGYIFKIGNATPHFSKADFPYLEARWRVEDVEIESAPNFPNDFGGQSNMRMPTYTAWYNFCKNVGLYEFFYVDSYRLASEHPGCVGITKEDVDMVTEALRVYQRKAALPAGFESSDILKDDHIPSCDGDLARLIWLEWWMRWAIENCETPAIENY